MKNVRLSIKIICCSSPVALSRRWIDVKKKERKKEKQSTWKFLRQFTKKSIEQKQRNGNLSKRSFSSTFSLKRSTRISFFCYFRFNILNQHLTNKSHRSSSQRRKGKSKSFVLFSVTFSFLRRLFSFFFFRSHRWCQSSKRHPFLFKTLDTVNDNLVK